MLASLLTFRSWQRPGAVANITMEDWRNRELKTADGKICSVIKVIRHKTAVHGAARIVLTNADVSKVDRYVRSIRPHLISDDETEHLLCLLGGAPI